MKRSPYIFLSLKEKKERKYLKKNFLLDFGIIS